MKMHIGMAAAHLASQLLVKENVPCGQVPMHKALSRQVCHTRSYLPCKPQEHVLEVNLIRVLTALGE